MILCFLCNSKLGITSRNGISIFGDQSILPSGAKLSDILSEITDKNVRSDSIHSTILCKKCHKSCAEFHAAQLKLRSMKKELHDQFRKSLEVLSLNYDTYEKDNAAKSMATQKATTPTKVIGKRLVLPASKLQPISADLLRKVGNLATVSKAGFFLPGNTKLTSLQSINLNQGLSNLTQKATITQEPVKIIDTKQHAEDSIDKFIVTPSASQELISFHLNGLGKDFLPVLDKFHVKSEGDDGHESQVMEMNEDSGLTVVPITSEVGDGDLIFEVNADKDEDIRSTASKETDTEYLELQDELGEDGGKLILSKLQYDTEPDEDNGEQTIVLNGDNGSILRMMAGRKLIYDGREISLVIPDHLDAHDNGDSQDSNDEGQIELQMSGDEETANAIIAAAQEQGGAFIKVESGELFRVQSVQSAGEVEDDGEEVAGLGGDSPTSHIVTQEGNRFKCMLCEKQDRKASEQTSCVGDADAIMRHLKSVHDARIYICQLCGLVVRKRSEYTHHIGQHAQSLQPGPGPRPRAGRSLLRAHACALCHKAFASKYTLHAHLKTHADRPRPFKCEQCSKAFLTQQNLNQHKKTHSGIKDFVCPICNKAFGTQHNLEVHGVVHSGARPFACSAASCRKAFARRAELRDHVRVHTGERPFACDICGATFAQRSNLHSHKRATHLDDKRYHCSQCDKRFKRRRLLQYHVKAVHTGERPLQCDVCNATFVYPEHFRKHQRIHSGERPYVCEICGKSFNSRDNRNTHRFVHSDKKPYECLTCGAGYMRKQHLYSHMHTSGHLAESIVVNHPRVNKVTDSVITTQLLNIPTADSKERTIADTIIETEELELHTDVKVTDASDDLAAKLFITSDKKFILHDKNVVQESEDPTLLTFHSIEGGRTAGAFETVHVDQYTEGAQIVTSNDGEMMRLIQIKLPDGNNRLFRIPQGVVNVSEI